MAETLCKLKSDKKKFTEAKARQPGLLATHDKLEQANEAKGKTAATAPAQVLTIPTAK